MGRWTRANSVARDLLNSCPPEHRGWEWDYLLGQTKEGVVSLTKFDTDWQRHGNNAVGPGGLRFSSDGKKMAVLNTAHLRVLDVANTAPTEDLNLEDPSLLAKVRHEWNGEARFGVAFSSDLRRLAATDNETVVVWDLATGKQVSRQSPEISPRLIHFLAFADEGSLSVVTTGFKNQGGKEKYMRPLVWDGVTGEAGSELEVHPVAIESHARYITSPTTVVDLASGSRVPIAIDVSRKLKACRFSSNGRWLFRHTVDGDKRDFFEVCDLNTGKINEVAAGIGPLDVSPQGDRLLTRSGIWDLARQQLILQLPGGTIGQWSPDGRRVAVAECAGWQIMYAPEHPELLPDKSDAPLTPYRKTIKLFRRTQPRYLAFSPDGTRIASASLDSTLRIWDAATGQPTLTFNGHTTPALNEHIAQSLHSFAFSPDGTRIASAGQTVKLWEAATGKEIRTFKRQNTQFTGVAFSPDGTRIAVGSTNGEVMLWDAATGTQLPTLKGHKGSISSVAFSPDGTRIASGSQDKTVTLWDATTGRATLTLREFADRVYRVTFSPDGRLIAASSHDGDVTLWDAVSGKRTLTIKGLDVAFSRDGRRLVSLSSGNSVKLWDAATGQELQTLTGHTAPVHCVAFSPDGTQIASGSMDETVIVWDLNTIPAAESTEQP
jgi:WD40 repeat protein